MYALTEPELLDEFASVYALIFFMQTLDHFAGMSLDWPMDVRALLSALVLPTSPLHLPYLPISPYISQVRALFSALSLANFNLQLLGAGASVFKQDRL